MYILKMLKEQRNFNDSEKILADYILENPQTVLEQSIQKLAQATFTSTSTIVRLCRKIGLKGFKDFRIKLAADLQMKYDESLDVDPDFPFSKNDSYKEIGQKLRSLYIESLDRTFALSSNENIEQIVDILLNAEKIGIFAYGDTFIPAMNFQNKMMKIGYGVQISNIPGENRHLATNFSPKDCVIVLSYSGESKNNYYITKILKRQRTKIIVITANPDSHIGVLGDLILPVFKNESKRIKISTFSSQISIDFALNTLFAAIFTYNFDFNTQKRIMSETLFSNERFSEKE